MSNHREISNYEESNYENRNCISVNVCCIVDVSGQLLMTRRSRLSSICDPDGEMIRKLKHATKFYVLFTRTHLRRDHSYVNIKIAEKISRQNFTVYLII